MVVGYPTVSDNKNNIKQHWEDIHTAWFTRVLLKWYVNTFILQEQHQKEMQNEILINEKVYIHIRYIIVVFSDSQAKPDTTEYRLIHGLPARIHWLCIKIIIANSK
jgi:hypothetical protein